MSESIIEVQNLSHHYGSRVALNDLSLSVQPGEIYGFLGPNGSGKTTLFRILSTLIPIRPELVKMLGMDLGTARTEIRRLIGVVFQSPSLDKQLTAEENLRHQGHLYGLGGSELARRIDEMLSLVGMADRPRDYCEALSGGQRRRIELAKGLLHRPRILLLDEPSTGLDPGARIDLWRYLRQIREQAGTTILVTTHLMEEAEHCDRLGIMNHGMLVANDTPAALKEQVGGDVITITTSDTAAVRSGLRDKFAISATELGSTLRIEMKKGHEFIPQLVEVFAGMISSVSLGKPTLEDVFVHIAGRKFEDHETPGAPVSSPAARSSR